MTTTDDKYAALQETGRRAAESIADMVAALECDYDRLAELREERDEYVARIGDTWRDDAPDESQELVELEAVAGDCESREDAEQRIQEDPLSVEVRGDWYCPGGDGDTGKPEEFCILLSTGGPATRIIGELDEHCQPSRARLQAQDWFTQWTDYRGDAISQDALLTYCQQFYFGE